MDMQEQDRNADAVLEYWFGPEAAARPSEADMKRWFGADPAIDRQIERRFGATVAAAGRGELDAWRRDARGTLALIILLDQFPRNLFRHSAAAFRYDPLALQFCLAGTDAGLDQELALPQRCFFLMPMQHSESIDIQNRSVAAFAQLAALASTVELGRCFEGFLSFARQHHDIIDRFGRFPHRNKYLGRADTDAERAFLSDGGAKFGQ